MRFARVSDGSLKQEPEKEEELEGVSGGIFVMLAPIFEGKELGKPIPNFKTMSA